MASGRMLKQTIATDKRLNDLSIEAEYLYLKCIPHLDRDGLIHGDAPVLWGTVCPRRTGLLTRIEELVSEWVSAGLVIRYDTKEGVVLFFAGFAKNQTIRYDREGASRFGPPPGFIRTESGLTPDEVQSTPKTPTKAESSPVESTPDLLLTNSGPTPDEVPVKLKESKLNQSKANGLIDSSNDRDGKMLVQRVRDAGFFYLDSQPTMIAMQLESDYSDSVLADALEKTQQAHQKQINAGGRGITAPFAYMRQVLLGMDTSAPVAPTNGNGNNSTSMSRRVQVLA